MYRIRKDTRGMVSVTIPKEYLKDLGWKPGMRVVPIIKNGQLIYRQVR